MRSMIIFVFAIGVGSLTVSGQEDKNAALLDQIEDLEKALRKKAAERRAPRDNMIIQRSYDVADLVARLRHRMLTPTNLIPSKYQPPEQADDREPTSPFEIDTLMDRMRQIIDPETWDQVEGADIQPKNGSLFVTNVPRVHAGIARLLERLRKSSRAQIVVDVAAVPVSPELARRIAQRPRALTPEDLAIVEKIAPLGTVRLVGANGQRVVQRNGKMRNYLQDYDVEIAENATIGDPIRQQVFEGCAAEVLPCLDRSAKGVLLQCRLERTFVHTPMRRIDTQHGPLDLPRMDVSRVNTTFWAPLGRTVIAGGTTAGKNPCLFLVTTRLVE